VDALGCQYAFSRLVAFKGRDPVRSKIVMDNKIIAQLNSFQYFGNLTSYEKEVEIDNKLNKYWKITGIINSVFRPQKTSKKTRIKLYNTLALPAFYTILKIGPLKQETQEE